MYKPPENWQPTIRKKDVAGSPCGLEDLSAVARREATRIGKGGWIVRGHFGEAIEPATIDADLAQAGGQADAAREGADLGAERDLPCRLASVVARAA